jgi:hypothetical protein
MAKEHYRSAIRKAAIRLLPFLALCYAVNFLTGSMSASPR